MAATCAEVIWIESTVPSTILRIGEESHLRRKENLPPRRKASRNIALSCGCGWGENFRKTNRPPPLDSRIRTAKLPRILVTFSSFFSPFFLFPTRGRRDCTRNTSTKPSVALFSAQSVLR